MWLWNARRHFISSGVPIGVSVKAAGGVTGVALTAAVVVAEHVSLGGGGPAGTPSELISPGRGGEAGVMYVGTESSSIVCPAIRRCAICREALGH